MTLSEPGRAKLTDPVELVQGLLAVAIVGGIVASAIVAHAVPTELTVIGTVVVGFYFGKSVQSGVSVEGRNVQ
jgi:CHASE1-domain containing sensor protein